MKTAFIDPEPVTSFCRILHLGQLSFLILNVTALTKAKWRASHVADNERSINPDKNQPFVVGLWKMTNFIIVFIFVFMLYLPPVVGRTILSF